MNEEVEIKKVKKRHYVKDDPDLIVWEYNDQKGNIYTSPPQLDIKRAGHNEWEKCEHIMKKAFLRNIRIMGIIPKT